MLKAKKSLYSYSIKGKNPNWDEAIPIGNGQLGALIYGEDSLKLTIDRIDLWDRRDPPETLEEGFNYKNLVKTAKENWEEHWRLFDGAYSHSYPTKLTVGRLEFPQLIDNDSVFELNMESAIAKVKTSHGSIEAFADANESIIALRVPAGLEFEIKTPAYISAPDGESEPLAPTETNENWDFEYSLKGLGYPMVKKIREGDFYYTVQDTKSDFSYGIIVLRKASAECDELYIDVYADTDGLSLDEVKARLLGCSQEGFNSLFKKHKKYWKNYYSISSVSGGDDAFDSYYIKSKYLFASTSREGGLPMSLQGVWTADNGKLPPWKADFHGDVNLQVSYEAYMKAGLFKEGSVLCDYLWDKRDVFRKYAKEFFGIDGLIIPGIFSIDGKAIGGWPQYAYDPVSGIWLAKCFDEYYLYTGDEEFFQKRAYPFLTELADSTVKILERNSDGTLCLPLTSSPEFFEGEPEAYLPSQSNFELSILKNLFTIVKSYSEKTGDDKAAGKYSDVLKKLKPYAQNSDGSLRICEEQDYDKSHRHFSHMLAICPFHLFSAKRDREIILANIEKLEHYGAVNWVGFSFVCMAELCAYIGEGNRAYRYMRDFMEGYTAKNGFHLNGDYKYYGYSIWHYRPFTLEAVMEFAKSFQDMFLSTDDGAIVPFPAIPDNWRDREIGFSNLVAYGGVRVSASSLEGRVTEFKLDVPKTMTLNIKNVFGKTMLSFKGEGGSVTVASEIGEDFSVTLDKGEYSLIL